jgi:hypothetical protein
MSESTVKSLALAVLEAMNTRQLHKIRALVTDDFVDHGAPPGVPRAPDAYIGVLTFVTEVLQIRYELHARS